LTIPILKKVCNAQLPEAMVDFSAIPFNARLGVWLVSKWFSQRGGLWVGGSVILYDDRMVFEANSLNNYFHYNLSCIEMPFKEVISVEFEPAFITNIITIRSSTQLLKIRCYGAKQLRETLLDLCKSNKSIE
jgi:hypothetical protein